MASPRSPTSPTAQAPQTPRPPGPTRTVVFGYDLTPQLEKLPAPIQRVVALVLTAQFAWFAGHVLTVWYSVWYILLRTPHFYSRALLGTILSYGIVLYKSYHSTFTPSDPNFRARISRDENLHYVLLALLWYLSNPLFPLLVPFATFSLFHVLTYTRTHILPNISPSLSGTVSPTLLKIVRDYQPVAIRAVAKYEIAVLTPLLIVGVFLRSVSLVQPVMFVQFLRQRWVFSATARQAVREVRSVLDGALNGSPLYVRAVGLLERLLESILPDGGPGGSSGRAQ
ncbi:hypothetical protein M427DRAFT_139726 [Gonapodya prolifera JEL478]|uniref:Endoplasmic reticulum protein n=1 Tax=Gonapodya prolifera (strain JEL478) TaxID=1344416 RepID=A0A139A0J0_GONPJ|nr:hypothetical protein M427DRAFT_139726 [Gonapodya prolifera JEL478]|eukprot:KXS10297.1 hypothetical protein M427DRAFT_139726 [Gonapodya prolifera JEL478]